MEGSLTVTGLMRQSARYNAGRTAIICGERRLSFDEAWKRGIQLANLLLELGLRPGDRVGVLEDNALESQDFFLGSAIAGLVRVPLYARNTPESHSHMLGHTGCRGVVVSAHYAAELQSIVPDLPELQAVLVRDDDYEARLAASSLQDPDIPIRQRIGASFVIPVEPQASRKAWPIAIGAGLLLEETGSTTFRRWMQARFACTWARFPMEVDICTPQPGYPGA